MVAMRLLRRIIANLLPQWRFSPDKKQKTLPAPNVIMIQGGDPVTSNRVHSRFYDTKKYWTRRNEEVMDLLPFELILIMAEFSYRLYTGKTIQRHTIRLLAMCL